VVKDYFINCLLNFSTKQDFPEKRRNQNHDTGRKSALLWAHGKKLSPVSKGYGAACGGPELS
jgi:hypothetical protein